jgi:hypothetical protein
MILLFSVWNTSAQSWECENCPKRSVGLFDIDNQVPKPVWGGGGNLTIGDWITFYFVAGGINEVLMYQDPSSECLTFYDGQFVLAMDSLNIPEDSLYYQVGVNFAVTPGSGPITGVNYIVYSKIYQSGSDYFITVYLETGTSRELISSNTIQYNFNKSGTGNGVDAAQFLIPLMGKIREFEKQKRDQNTDIAIRAKVELTPQKFYIATNSSTQVKVRLVDCDDEVLKNRQVDLTVTYGSLSSYSVTTNNNGEAFVTYTAGSSSAWVKIEATYDYNLPFGQPALLATSGTFICVQYDYTDLWYMEISTDVSETRMADTSWSIQIPNTGRFDYKRTLSSSSSGNAEIRAVITNECSFPDLCYFESEPPEVTLTWGNCAGFEKETDLSYLSGEIPQPFGGGYLVAQLDNGSEIRTDAYDIPISSGGGEFEYSSTYKGYYFGGLGDGIAKYIITEWWSGQWEVDEGTYSFSCGAGASWGEGDTGGSFTLSDSVYTVTFNKDSLSYQYSWFYGTITTNTSIHLNGTIKPLYRRITGIDEESDPFLFIPGEYDIVNYPNPFNPSTKIRYSIPSNLNDQMSKVSLKVYDVLGNLVSTLVDEFKPAGTYQVEFNPVSGDRYLASGFYLCRFQTEKYSRTIKMLYLK